jgi:hypothetical protein
MSVNELIALDAKLKQAHNERANELLEDDFFEIFTAEQVLKDFDLTDEEIEFGQVGGENDGGLDSVYFLINRQLVMEDTEINPRTVTKVSLFFIQATREQSFNEERITKLNLLTEDFLDFSRSIDQLQGNYNRDVIYAITIFKDKYKALFICPHELVISYYYISKGETKTINTGVKRQSERVQEKAKQLFPTASVSFNFIGAAQLLDLINEQPQKSYQLEYSEMLSPSGQNAFVCLVPLSNYYNFITNDRGEMKNEYFEGNVRDWEGDVTVNTAILNTLKNGNPNEDFWWLNNGITILASNATNLGGHILSVERPQIVNGLQTSRCIYNYFNASEEKKEGRNVLVRIISTQLEESPDHIIKATNSQTQVPPFRLHMTEQIHRNIEVILRNYNLYYDRRKNYYKNEGKPITRIVQPLVLAQTIMAIVLQRPDDARGRPNTVLEKSYKDIFSNQYPLPLYSICALLVRKVNSFLLLPDLEITRTERGDLRWYIAMQYSRLLTNKKTPNRNDLAKITLPTDDQLLRFAYDKVKEIYSSLGGTHEIAKGTELIKKVKELSYSKPV